MQRQRLYSLRALSREFSVSRDFIKARFEEAGVEPEIANGGRSGYRLREALEALLPALPGRAGSQTDPDRMTPAARRSWFQSEQLRLDSDIAAGKLIPALQHERDVAVILGIVMQTSETMPDILERDEGLAPPQVQRLQEILDAKRQELYEQLASDEDSERA